MCWFRLSALFLLCSHALAAGDGYLLGAGLEGDSEDGLRLSALGGIGVTERTWLSGALSRSRFELPIGEDSDTTYADLELDHWFEPIGVRAGMGYWGDADILDSNDWRTSLYYRNDTVTLAGNYEHRDFDFVIPATDFFSGREVTFDADGFGGSLRIRLSDDVGLSLAGMAYDYSVDFRPAEDRDILRLISVSRLSLINSLIDNRARIGLSRDRGLRRWELGVTTSEGAIDRSRTNSFTLRYLFPVGARADLELGVGYDVSELYENVTFLSAFLYFYGGN